MQPSPDFKYFIIKSLQNKCFELLFEQLNIPEEEILNYLNQLFINLSQEVANDIYVIPFSGLADLSKLMEIINRGIIKNWLEGYSQKYQNWENEHELIIKILQDFDAMEELIKYLQLENFQKYKDQLMPLIAVDIQTKFKKNKIQVQNDLFLVTIDKTILGAFFTILNSELAFKWLPVQEIQQNAVIQFSDPALSSESEEKQQLQEVQNSANQLNINLATLIKGLYLKLPADNERKPFKNMVTPYIKYFNFPKHERGLYLNQDNFKSFKVLRYLSNELFERSQFFTFLNKNANNIPIKFDIQVFDKVQDGAYFDNNLLLKSVLFQQLINSTINTRELKEGFYKYLYMSMQSQRDIINKNSTTEYFYLTKGFREDPSIKRPNQEYFKHYVYPHLCWVTALQKWVSTFSKDFKLQNVAWIIIYFQRTRGIFADSYIAFMRVIGFMIFLESDQFIEIIQSMDKE